MSAPQTALQAAIGENVRLRNHARQAHGIRNGSVCSFLEKSEIELVEDIDESVIKAAEAERAEGAARRRRKQKGAIILRPE